MEPELTFKCVHAGAKYRHLSSALLKLAVATLLLAFILYIC